MSDNYDFLKEQVKKQKPYTKWLKRGLAAAFSGLIFGIVVVLILVFVYPRIDKKVNSGKTVQVDLGTSRPDGENNQAVSSEILSLTGEESTLTSETAASETEEASSETEESVTSSAVSETEETEETSVLEETTEETTPQITTVESLTQMSADLVAMKENLAASMVTVIGVTEDKDWFNETYENQGQLSGLIVAQENNGYYILTEYRVVENVKRIMVTFADGSISDARFVKSDTATGLAVIRVDKDNVERETREKISPAELTRYSGIKQGDAVVALGSPMGYADAISAGFVTSVSNLCNVTDNAYHILCTDIPASEEGSGILVDMKGKVVGIMAQQLLDTKGLGQMVCLPIDEIVDVVEKLCNNEEIACVGITGQDVTGTISENTGIPKGIWVDSVEKDSPAMESGIQAGDIVYKLNETGIGTMAAFNNILNQHKVGEKVTISVMRSSAEGYVEVEFNITIQGR